MDALTETLPSEEEAVSGADKEGVYSIEALANDAKQVVELVNSLDGGDTKARFDLERIAAYLERHQEQPELLDPYLADILTPLVDRMKTHQTDSILEDVSKVLYILVKVRGYKTVGTHSARLSLVA